MKKYITICLIITFFTMPVMVSAQKQGAVRIDSLLTELPNIKEDTNGVNLLGELSNAYETIDPNEGIKYATRERVLANKIHWQKGEAAAWNNLGNNHYYKGAMPDALQAYFQAMRLHEKIGNESGIGAAFGNIGNVYQRQKNYPKALEYQFKALKVAEKFDDKMRMLTSYGNIGWIYTQQGNYDEALKYQMKALHIAQTQNDKIGISRQYTNTSVMYTGLKQYSTALIYCFKALRIAQEIGDKRAIAINLGNIGENYYEIAVNKDLFPADSLVKGTSEANLSLSVEYLKKSVAGAQEAQLWAAVPEFSEYLSKALMQRGDHKGALSAFKYGIDVRDSLYNIANNEKISDLETQRALELKDKDIQIASLEVARKRNERWAYIGGIVVLLLILGILLRSFRRQRISNALLATEKQRSDDLLLNILPTEVAEELKINGKAKARHFDNVSVLFTDFVNFTKAAEQLSPQALVDELHECFTAFDVIMERHGLEKIKTVGDAYLAVCGLPNSDPLHARKTVLAAADILAFMTDPDKKHRAFGIRIGVNSGSVIAGIVGVKKFAYDIWGDTVNIAARMEQHGETDRINISQSTYELVKNDFSCTYRGDISAKNKGEIAMYFIDK